MKKVLKSAEPELLAAYRLDNPTNNWEQYKGSAVRKRVVFDRLKNDQSGLCAYCEIKLLPSTVAGEADFRVEHFHPKSDNATSHNWHLDWQNLLGCCHGGSQKNVVDGMQRFTKGDYTCDIPKGSKHLASVILNPLHLPAFPALFLAVRSSGRLKVNVRGCFDASISESKVEATITELRLDSARLNRFRKTLLDELNRQITQLTRSGLSVGAARTQLASILLCKDTQDYWPAFFTTIRSYLGYEAETHLQQSGFDG